jgi:hypothetical protein
LAEEQYFTIDWEAKNTEEHGRWTEALEELGAILLTQKPSA